MNYLAKNPNANRLRLVHPSPPLALTLLKFLTAPSDLQVLDVAYGLQHLHSLEPPIVHSGLKGSSILISDAGRAVVADFGLRKAVENLADSVIFPEEETRVPYRWMAPELLADEALIEKSIDIYAWGMTALEVCPNHTHHPSPKQAVTNSPS